MEGYNIACWGLRGPTPPAKDSMVNPLYSYQQGLATLHPQKGFFVFCHIYNGCCGLRYSAALRKRKTRCDVNHIPPQPF
jgi:hypothetical protein